MNARQIDKAMAEDRKPKEAIRAKWVEVCVQWRELSTHEPLYVTLPGSDGLDIGALISAGVLPVHESGAIVEEAAGLVVAVERNLPAASNLRNRYPGLKVLHQDIFVELRVKRVITDLSKEAQTFGNGLVVNLDFDKPLTPDDDDRLVAIELIDRIADVHRLKDPQDWTLLLTVNTNTNSWSPAMNVRHAKLLSEAIDTHDALGEWWSDNGRDLGGVLDRQETFADWSPNERQRMLLVLIPLLLLSRVSATYWDVRVRWSAAYGEPPAAAAMVTWAIDFVYDPDTCATPAAHRSTCTDLVLKSLGSIDTDGAYTAL